MDDYSKVKVGDTVWFSDVNRKGLTEAVVTKVGPKLITLDGRGLAFRKDTGQTNDAYQHQTLIVDLELYEAERMANNAFRLFKMGMNFTRNSGVTVADIHAAARALKIKI